MIETSNSIARKAFYTSFAVALTIALAFMWYVLSIPADAATGIWAWLKESNMRFYFLALVLFAVSLIGVRLLWYWRERSFSVAPDKAGMARELPRWAETGVTILVTVVFCSLLIKWFLLDQFNEMGFTGDIPYFWSPKWIFWTAYFVCAAAIALLVWKKRDIPKAVLYAVCVAAVILTFISLDFVNLFLADHHHGVAAVESVYNVFDGIPYTLATTGIYGHYALFFWLPLKILGCSPATIGAMFALSGSIAVAAALYVTFFFLPKNWMRLLAALAIPANVATFRTGNYWQVTPLRVLFPLIFCAYVVFLTKRKIRVWNTRWMWLGFLLGAFALLWNVESGVFSLCGFSAYLIVSGWQKYAWYSSKMWKRYVCVLLCSVGSFILMLVLLNAYNLLCGGPLIFRAAVFPLFESHYMNAGLRYDMVWGNHLWVYVLALFLAVCAGSIYHTRIFKSEGSVMWSGAPAAMMISVQGLLSFSYYANRAAYYNLDICYMMAICAGGVVVCAVYEFCSKRTAHTVEKALMHSAALLAMMILLFFGLHTLMAPSKIEIRASRGYYDSESLRENALMLAEEIPENTFGVGSGISILYHILGWDNYAHYRDMSDLTLGGTAALDAMVEQTLHYDAFLIAEDNNGALVLESILQKDPSYQLKKTIQIYTYNFYYYAR